MIKNYKHSVKDRFLKYVCIDTQSNPDSSSFPSTEKQKNLAKILEEELKNIGVLDAFMDEHGYVFGTIPASKGIVNKPTICFCSHIDTAPDCSGTDVKPIMHSKYNGQPIILPDDISQIITKEQHPYLKEKIGDDIITASGKTLLGADDKAGVAIIMDLAAYFIQNPSAKHSEIRILFTPDEEVGRGVEKLDMKKVNANFGFTLDGGKLGSLEYESFSADAMKFRFKGIAAHPGYAKNKLVNAVKVASYFLNLLPKDNWSPETTEENEGFVHPMSITGHLEEAKVEFIIRSFDTQMLKNYEDKLINYAQEAIKAFEGSAFDYEVKEQYRNMGEIINQHTYIIDFAKAAMQKIGIEPIVEKIRGGTDGSRLSFMGLPCPNLFTGEMAIHSKHEFVSVQDMEKAVAVCAEICAMASS